MKNSATGAESSGSATWSVSENQIRITGDFMNNLISGEVELILKECPETWKNASVSAFLTDKMHLVHVEEDRYVDTAMLDIKLQNNYNAAKSGTNKFNIRFISSVNNLNYEETGFIFYVGNEEGYEPTIKQDSKNVRKTTKVYRALRASGVLWDANRIYDDYSKYINVFVIKNVPADKVIYVRAYVKLENDKVIYGDTRRIIAPSAKP